MERPDVLLLDAGNTLVFLDHAALSAAAAEVGLSVSADALFRAEPTAKRAYEAKMQSGMSQLDGWMLHMQVIFETAGLLPPDAGKASESAWRAHRVFNLWRKVPADLPDALTRALDAGLRLGIISNAEGTLMELLDRLDLSRYFEQVIDSELEGVRKPNPAIFELGLSRMGVAAARALYAGDIPRVDVEGARAVGMDAALIDALDHYPEYREAPRFASVALLLRDLGI